jgi:hypothetical protein
MRTALIGLMAGLASSAAWGADVFDRHTARELHRVLEQGPPTVRITLNDAARLKPLAANLSSPCVAVRTDEGNVAKVLLGWGLRKGGDQPTPVVLLERFVTFRSDRPELTTAVGKEVMLFPGFGFNLDIGQVVPDGHGADIEFTARNSPRPIPQPSTIHRPTTACCRRTSPAHGGSTPTAAGRESGN